MWHIWWALAIACGDRDGRRLQAARNFRRALVVSLVWVIGIGAHPLLAEEPIQEFSGQSRHVPGEPAEADEQLHQPRHGGFFGDANDLYHYELVLDPPNHLRLYVNDERNQPLHVRNLTGRWTLYPGTAEAVSGSFEPAAEGEYFLANLPIPLPATVPVEISVQKGQIWAAMEFELPVSQPASR